MVEGWKIMENFYKVRLQVEPGGGTQWNKERNARKALGEIKS
jgi:hypothetical protein